MLNPIAFIEEAQTDALKPLDETKPDKRDSKESAGEEEPQDPSSDKPPSDSKQQESKPPAAAPKQAGSKPTTI